MRRSVLAIAGSILVIGCGNESNFNNTPVPPIARIQPIESGPASDLYTFQIDGRESYDPNAAEPNGIYEYEWAIESTPTGATANIGGWGVADFVTDTPGRYVVRLRVRDINDFAWSDWTYESLRAFPVTGIAATLVWETDVDDVDLHLINETQGGGLFDEELDCHFANLRPDWAPMGSSDGDPELNHDEVDGLGPETIELPVPTIGETYRVLIHYFSDDDLYPETEARVKLWINGALAGELERDLVANNVWDVGLFNWSGAAGSFEVADTLSEY